MRSCRLELIKYVISVVRLRFVLELERSIAGQASIDASRPRRVKQEHGADPRDYVTRLLFAFMKTHSPPESVMRGHRQAFYKIVKAVGENMGDFLDRFSNACRAAFPNQDLWR